MKALGAALIALSLAASISGCAPLSLIPTTGDIDPELALDLACACIQTYRAYNRDSIQPPPGYRYDNIRFFGKDVFAFIPKKVLYGLVFQKADHPGEVIFAFRGTRGFFEWWSNLRLIPIPFEPHEEGRSIPFTAMVESGMFLVYHSMRDTLFYLVDTLRPERLYVTGHSLGGALAELFVLDLALSRPETFPISYTFGSPKVGNRAFARLYDSQPQQKAHPTVRIVNNEDMVPDLPFWWTGFVQAGVEYPICFRRKDGDGFDPAAAHSADNYLRFLRVLFEEGDHSCRLEKKMPYEIADCNAFSPEEQKTGLEK